jgi:hypothetical protein
MSELFNFMKIESSIVERLEFVTQHDIAGIPAWCRKVGTTQYLAMVQESKQVTPAIYVVYQGKTLLSAQGTKTREAHRWAVVLTIKNAADQTTTAALNSVAGLYLAQIQASLLGFTPEGAMEALTEVSPPPPYYSSGFAYFPLMFEARVLLSSKFGSGIARASDVKRDVLTNKVKDY